MNNLELNNTPLMEAIIKGNYKIAKQIIESGVDVNDVDSQGKTPLFYAMQPTGLYANVVKNYNCNEKLWFIELLIDKGAEINIMTNDKITPLMIASQMKSDKVVKLLIQKGANINEKDKNGETALLKFFNHVGPIPRNGIIDRNMFLTLKLFLDKTADTSIKNTQDKTPFILAVKHNLSDAIKLFIRYDVDIKNANIDMQSLFLKSLWYNDNFELSTYLLNNKFDINSLDKNKNTPLLSIIQDEYSENIIEFLIYNKADINIENEFGYTPLMLLIRDLEDEENRKIILHLIRESQNINTTLKDDKLITAHTIAIINKKEKFAKILEAKGADTSITLKYLLANDLYFEKEYFEKKLEAFLPEKIEKKMRLYLLESWSYFNQRIDVDKIDKCIFLLEKLKIKIGQNKNSFGYIKGYCSYKQIDEILAEVKQELKNNLYSIDSKTFKDVLSQFIDFPNKPKELVNLLKNFRKNTPIKYTTHSWDMNFKKEYNDFNGYLSKMKKQFNDIEKQLKELSTSIHEKIYNFLINSDANAKSWYKKDGVEISIGWSSLVGLEKWCNDGQDPFKFKLEKTYIIKEKNMTTFGDVINLFKHEIQIRTEDNILESLFIDIDEELDTKHNDIFEFKYYNLEGKSFYTDVSNFKNAIDIIFLEIKKKLSHPNIKVEIVEDKDSEYYDLKIIQLGSLSGKSAKEMLGITDGGDSSKIKESLKNLCDWSIESSYEDKGYRINYFKNDYEILDYIPKGFTHIMRFYK